VRKIEKPATNTGRNPDGGRGYRAWPNTQCTSQKTMHNTTLDEE
jgi:hypothetical protein